jgi:DNA-binding transcriptional MerR regulator
MKTRGSHRQYKRRDVELAVQIKRLLHDQGFTIPGARRRLKELGQASVRSEPDPAAAREMSLKTELLGVREALASLLAELDAVRAAPEPKPQSVRVDKVIAGVPVGAHRS